MKFQIAHPTDITEQAKQFNEDYNEYEKIFIVPDYHDIHILRILKGYEYNEEDGYVENQNKYMLEWQKVTRPSYKFEVNQFNFLQILKDDDMGNWSCNSYDSIEECISVITNDGFFQIQE